MFLNNNDILIKMNHIKIKINKNTKKYKKIHKNI